MAIYRGTDGNDSTGGTIGSDVRSGASGDDTIWGGPGGDYIGGDFIGVHIPTRYQQQAAGFNVPITLADDMRSANASDPAGTPYRYEFVNNNTVNLQIYYVEPDGSITAVGNVPLGQARSFNVNSAGGKFIAVNNDTGEIYRHMDVTGNASAAVTTDIKAVVQGNDSLSGGAGDDTIFGDGGNDRLYGGDYRENDTAYSDSDYLDGGAGTDTIYAGAGNDKLAGGTDNDTLMGELGRDTLVGGGGTYSLSGGDGNDIIHGDNYTIIDSSATDGRYTNIFGNGLSASYKDDSAATHVTYRFVHDVGGNIDVYYIQPNGDLAFVTSVSSGNYNGASLPANASIAIVQDSVIMGVIPRSETGAAQTYDISNYMSGTFGETAPGAAADLIDGGAGADTIYAQAGDDVVEGGTGADFIDAGSGGDKVVGGEGSDIILTGSGDDVVYGESESGGALPGVNFNDLINTGAGRDIVYGQQGNDTVSGGIGNDDLFGGVGNDRLLGDGGADSLEGGDGNDTLTGDGPGLLPRRIGSSQTVPNFLTSDAGSDTAFTGPGTGAGKTAVTFENNYVRGVTIYYVEPDGTLKTATMGIPNGGNNERTFHFPENSNVVAVDGASGEIVGYYADITDPSWGGSIEITAEGNEDADQFAPTGGNDTLIGGAGRDDIDGMDGDDTIDGGADADVMRGGVGDDAITVSGGDQAYGEDDRDTFTFDLANIADGDTITIDGGTGSTAAGDIDDWDTIDLTGLTIVSHTNVLEDADGNSYSGSVVLSDGSKEFTVRFTELEQPLCYCRGTMIETIDGLVAVEDLHVGDMVRTKDNGFKPLIWIGASHLSEARLVLEPGLRPIRIQADALAPGYPSEDLYVSPQHRVLVRSRVAQKMFGVDEVLVAAKQLLMLDGIDYADDAEGVDYYHFLFDQHEVVYSNGAETESLYTGPEALKSLSEDARVEILAIFPELRDLDYDAVPARMLSSGRLARKLAIRHRKNQKPLYAAGRL
ncbi:Hint domain-containing protein [Paracoccus aerodenitrificans]|uniref:Hint domain-containing protein n=1 Tax=Paracoccus aerodenitrificans TaxID=3017781 RepID=UPI0022F0583B|nr:Hint domain-containing protein [Paracoccus aerodenitrificans]WBU63799.1 Hint domain-containing protein [Paracoccus aerodenitrificans]